jgi:hypothetical protein
MEQLDYFQSDAHPTFAEIVEGIVTRLLREWAAYDRSGGLLVEADPKFPYVFENLVDTEKLRRDILKVVRWMKQGFPETASSTIPLLCLKSVIKDDPGDVLDTPAGECGRIPWGIDLKDVNSARRRYAPAGRRQPGTMVLLRGIDWYSPNPAN